MTYLKLITPINIAEEKEKFFDSPTYSPQFEYRWDSVYIKKYKAAKPELAELVDALVSQDRAATERAAKRI